jgi:hypothetical protein
MILPTTHSQEGARDGKQVRSPIARHIPRRLGIAEHHDDDAKGESAVQGTNATDRACFGSLATKNRTDGSWNS